MKLQTTIALCCFLLLSAMGVQAQNTGTIEGTVTDEATGEVIPAVNVALVGTTKGAATTTAGEYEITDIEPGQYRIEATYLGYANFESDLIEVEAGQTITLDITLEETVWQGNEVVVSGSKRPEKLLESPTTIARVSQEELETTGGATFMSSLSNLKGVNYSNAGINTQLISARGFNSSFNTRLLFMIDGRLATLGATGLPQGNFLPASKIDVKSMEVVLGPASALYGPNSGSGIINVRTKDPWDDSGVTVSSRIGNQSLGDFTFRAAGTVNNKLGWKVTGQYMEAVDFKPKREDNLHFYRTDVSNTSDLNNVFETDVAEDYEVGAKKINGALYYQLGGWKISGKYGWSSTSQFSLTSNGRNRIEDWKVNYQTLSVSSDHWYAQVTRNGNEAGSYQLNQVVTAVQSLVSQGVPLGQVPLGNIRQSVAFVDDTETYDSELQYNNTFGSFDIVAGINYRNMLPESQGTYLADGGGQDISRELFGGYAQVDYDLIPDKLALTAAARIDENTDYETQFSPKGSLVYTVTEGHNVRATYNRAFTSPTILQSHSFIPVPNAIPNNMGLNYALLIKGNTDGYTVQDPSGNVVRNVAPVDPEEVNSMELGYKGVFGQKLFIDIVGYHSWYKNFIGTEFISDGATTLAFQDGNPVEVQNSDLTTVQTYVNYGEAEVHGIDVGMNYYFNDRYSVNASMSAIKIASFTKEPGRAELPLNTPPIKFKGGFTAKDFFSSSTFREPFVKISGRWRDSYEYVSGYWDSNVLLDDDGNPNNKEELSPKFELDLSAGFDIADSGFSVKGNINNLLDTDNVDLLGSAPIGRTYWVSVKFDFNGFRF